MPKKLELQEANLDIKHINNMKQAIKKGEPKEKEKVFVPNAFQHNTPALGRLTKAGEGITPEEFEKMRLEREIRDKFKEEQYKKKFQYW